MDVEEDLLIVDEVGVSSQQAGREQTSARPVFSDPERVYCRVADPGQERLRRSEGSGGYSYADAVRDRVQQRASQPDVLKIAPCKTFHHPQLTNCVDVVDED
ncbi:hypothetical protein HELRODRAFT_175959 [Helobdella robusta]|uniref:Uncharacterized protein n=1 Tax=Helobdella robusta TaxID=6412 RepID=T1F9Z0_HELRO|nr:hypothetical protein HELRODRAFT_175959 [Helobdella robusta]ESO00516.1 hypothetical protein HELRODRAFT_175959 [Helobdella robusta]